MIEWGISLIAYLMLLQLIRVLWAEFLLDVRERERRAEERGRSDGRAEGITEQEAKLERERLDPHKGKDQERRTDLKVEEQRVGERCEIGVELRRQIAQSIAKTSQQQAQIERRGIDLRRQKILFELSALGWMPMDAQCLPERDQQILVGGLAHSDTPNDAGSGWPARFLGHWDGSAHLRGDDTDAIEVELDGSTVWVSLDAWPFISDQQRSRQLLRGLEGAGPRRFDDVPRETSQSFANSEIRLIDKRMERLEQKVAHVATMIRSLQKNMN